MGKELPWPFWYFDAYIRPWEYLHPRSLGLEMLMGLTVFYGAICFVVGAFSDSSPWWPLLDEDHRERFWLVYVTFFVGSYLFTASCALQAVLAINQDWEGRLSDWKINGGAKPRLRIFEFAPLNLFWLSGCTYTFGAVLYNVGTTFSLINAMPGAAYPRLATVYAGQMTFAIGGVFFLIGGFLPVLEREKRRWFIGMFIPTKREDWVSLDYWVNWFNWWGGVGFCMSGPFLLFPNIDVNVYRIENFFGFGIGSVCFLIVGLMICIKLSLARHHQLANLRAEGSGSTQSRADLLPLQSDRSGSYDTSGPVELSHSGEIKSHQAEV